MNGIGRGLVRVYQITGASVYTDYQVVSSRLAGPIPFTLPVAVDDKNSQIARKPDDS
jgi:hypothetical protein